MVKQIVRDVFFLGQKSEPATRDDLQVGRDLKDTLNANRDRCVGMAGLAEMYQDYIEGKKELRQINMEFSARYIKGGERPDRIGFSYQK